jgi:hypothetical protein
MRRCVERWRTPLGRFVGEFGVARLTAAFAARGDPISGRLAYAWLAGAVMPRPERALALVALSRGRLTMAEVFGQRAAILRRAGQRVAILRQSGSGSRSAGESARRALVPGVLRGGASVGQVTR